jgi:hypothetical protein
MLVVVGGCLFAGLGMAADSSLSLNLGSAYIFRGVTYNDGMVFQPSLNVNDIKVGEDGAAGAFGVGVWGNLDLDDYNGTLNNGEFSEVDLYGSWLAPLESVDLTVGYNEYTYPSGGGDADRELSILVGAHCLLSPSLGVYYGIDGGVQNSLYVEGMVSYCWQLREVDLTAGGLVSYRNPDEGESGFAHWGCGLIAGWRIFEARISYIDKLESKVLGDAYDVGLAGSLGVTIPL